MFHCISVIIVYVWRYSLQNSKRHNVTQPEVTQEIQPQGDNKII